MHLTEADVDPIFIRDFLGHADLKRTQIYSKTSVEIKRKAIETILERTPVPDDTQRQKMDWTEDKDLMA